MIISEFIVADEPENEAERLALVIAYELGSGNLPPDAQLQALIAETVARFQMPIVQVSIITADEQRFRAGTGLEAASTPRSVSFCGHAILGAAPLIVEDTLIDLRFAGNPLVVGRPNLRFYAGAPLIAGEGLALGSLCVMDILPRAFSSGDAEELVVLAAAVMARLVALRP